MARIPMTLSKFEGHFFVTSDKTCCVDGIVPLRLQSFLSCY